MASVETTDGLFDAVEGDGDRQESATTFVSPQVDDETERQEIFSNHLRFPNVYISWKSTDSPYCDRRLSRAARKLLKEHLLRIINRNNRFDNNNIDNNSDVWTLVDHWYKSLNTKAANLDEEKSKNLQETCPLYMPSRDIYREEELQNRIVSISSLSNSKRNMAMKAAYPNHVLKSRRDKHSSDSDMNSNQHWYQCGYCGKMFVTQFYLDFHMMNQHHSIDQTKTVTICPANDLCHLLGIANCHDRALQDEPYYDRGSGGLSQDRSWIKHKWNKVTHSIPCSVESLHKICHGIFKKCGMLPTESSSSDYDDDWVNESPQSQITMAEQFCQSLTCPHQRSLWQYLEAETYDLLSTIKGDHDGSRAVLPSLAASAIHEDWHNIWIQEVHHHRRLFSVLGVLAIVFIVVYMLRMIASFSSLRRRDSRLMTPGKRLLSKGRRNSQQRESSWFGQNLRRPCRIKND